MTITHTTNPLITSTGFIPDESTDINDEYYRQMRVGGDDRVTAEAHLATLQSSGLIEPQTDFKGNFVKRGL